jgi:hypothetical protein
VICGVFTQRKKTCQLQRPSASFVAEKLFGTVAVICVSELTLKLAETLWKATPVVPVKPQPVMVTLVPGAPEVGVKLLNPLRPRY